jgi:hypothetical protein
MDVDYAAYPPSDWEHTQLVDFLALDAPDKARACNMSHNVIQKSTPAELTAEVVAELKRRLTRFEQMEWDEEDERILAESRAYGKRLNECGV